MVQHLRVARHTDSLEAIKAFYVNLLGFNSLTSFENHEGYSGVMIGHKGHSWHFEFTTSDKIIKRSTDPDDLIVLYFDNSKAYDSTINRLEKNKIESVNANNPYWDNYGKTYIDPDGFRIVLVNRKW